MTVTAGWAFALLGLPVAAAWVWAYRTKRYGLSVLLAWGVAVLSTAQALVSPPGSRLLPTVITIGWVIAALLDTQRWSRQPGDHH